MTETSKTEQLIEDTLSCLKMLVGMRPDRSILLLAQDEQQKDAIIDAGVKMLDVVIPVSNGDPHSQFYKSICTVALLQPVMRVHMFAMILRYFSIVAFSQVPSDINSGFKTTYTSTKTVETATNSAEIIKFELHKLKLLLFNLDVAGVLTDAVNQNTPTPADYLEGLRSENIGTQVSLSVVTCMQFKVEVFAWTMLSNSPRLFRTSFSANAARPSPSMKRQQDGSFEVNSAQGHSPLTHSVPMSFQIMRQAKQGMEMIDYIKKRVNK